MGPDKEALALCQLYDRPGKIGSRVQLDRDIRLGAGHDHIARLSSLAPFVLSGDVVLLVGEAGDRRFLCIVGVHIGSVCLKHGKVLERISPVLAVLLPTNLRLRVHLHTVLVQLNSQVCRNVFNVLYIPRLGTNVGGSEAEFLIGIGQRRDDAVVLANRLYRLGEEESFGNVVFNPVVDNRIAIVILYRQIVNNFRLPLRSS